MKRRYRDLSVILDTMSSYIRQMDDDEMAMEYLKELANTGLFHDAIGKVTEIANDHITVTEEY